MSKLVDQIAEAILRVRYSDDDLALGRTEVCSSGECRAFLPSSRCLDEFDNSVHPMWTEFVEARAASASIIKTLGLQAERRLVTPQGTTRAVRGDEHLGAHPRELQWWIERRYTSLWLDEDV